MIDSKTRAFLRKEASKLEPVLQIGHGGISENLLFQIDGVLETRELVKISVLPNSDVSAKSVINEIATILHAEPIIAIGNKFVLYRYSKKVKNHVISKMPTKVVAK